MDIKKPTSAQQSRHVQSEVVKQDTKRTFGSLATVVVLVLTLAVLVTSGVFGYQALQKAGSTVSGDVQEDRFQAVFLTNGQVYFGKLSNVEGNYIKLKNIYYLQVQQAVQPSTSNPEQQSDTSDSQVSLTKLGKELHGPTDQMFISRSEVLFWENLEKDSTVVKAIADYENK